VIEAERRIAGDILNDAFSGRLAGPALARRLELVGFRATGRLTALVLEARDATSRSLEDLAWAADAVLGRRAPAARTAVVGERVAALVSGGEVRAHADALAGELGAVGDELGPGPLRVGIGNPAEPPDVRDSYLSAVFALRAAPVHWRIASPEDLGAFDLLLGAQSRPVLEGFVRSLLGPLIERDRERSSELVESLRAFLAASGRWEQGAEALGVHRHTLRYRMRQAETLLDRDLSSAEDRLELWLALKALEVLDE
jgi:purine catabolism regulator